MKKESKQKRNILLCVAGATPQIITETLYYLTVQKKEEKEENEKIDEIRVITTLEGRDRIMKGREGNAEESLLDKKEGQFYAFLRDYPQVGEIEFNETKIALLKKRDGQMLEDIRTPEENELAGDQICDTVREICKDESIRVFASAAGGRKTMSIYLTLAMSLFGRAEDSLSHVLVSADFEMNRHFFYPPPIPKMIDVFNPATKVTKKASTADAEIYLAPIPFIRLCGIGKDNKKFGEARTYGEMVTEAQNTLDIREKEYDLLINIKNQTTTVCGNSIKLTPREFFFYLIFVKKRFDGHEIFSISNLNAGDFHFSLKENLLATKNEDVDWEEIYAFPKYKFAETMLAQLESGRERDFQDFRAAFSKVVTLIANKFSNKGVDERYYLVSTDDGTASYRLQIAPERIKFIE